MNLLAALKFSCNIFFYDVGRRTGLDAFSRTAQALGLGADTGVELPSAEGALTWTTDPNYQSGLTLQAAIGQGNTAVTPLQLAAYATALAGNGVRPALHYARRALSADGEPLWEYVPTPRALRRAARPCSARSAKAWWKCPQRWRRCGACPVTLACKTGSHSGRSAPRGAGITPTRS